MSNSLSMAKPVSIVLEPDIDDFCYLLAQAIMRQLEQEDAAIRGKQKHSQGRDNEDTTASPVKGVDSNQTEEILIDH